MKASLIIALPALALAAANPVKIEERQLPGLNLACVTKITELAACTSATPDLQSLAFLAELFTCPIKVISEFLDCII